MASGSGLVDWFEASVQGSRTLERPNWSCSRATTRGLTCAPSEVHRSAWVPTAQPRDIGLGAAGVLLLGGLAVLAGAFVFGVVGEPAVLVLMLLFFGGFAAMLLSVLPFQRVSLGRLSLAYVTADGSAVHVSNPSPEFAAELRK